MEIKSDGYASLDEGQKVEFEIGQGKKARVRPMSLLYRNRGRIRKPLFHTRAFYRVVSSR